ncbi:DUF92 domain-containing protein [Halomicroarcula sp. GCM10025709]
MLDPSVATQRIAVALVVTAVLGYVSYALDTASLPGMLTGILLALLTIVLGGYGWFAMLVTFFGLGGLSSKYRYEEKLSGDRRGERRGQRQRERPRELDRGARRGSGDRREPSHIAVDPVLFLYAFAGAVAAAMTDTFSSEFGGLYDNPRLITTFRRVEPGTDGAVTWQGVAAGLVGAGIIAGIASVLLAPVGTVGAVAVVVCGLVGMTVDSLLGATVEGTVVGNQGVNMLATLTAAITGAVLALGGGLV